MTNLWAARAVHGLIAGASSLHMVAVQVRVAAGPDKIADVRVAPLRHHMHQ